jgi:hypothetical protein
MGCVGVLKELRVPKSWGGDDLFFVYTLSQDEDYVGWVGVCCVVLCCIVMGIMKIIEYCVVSLFFSVFS